MLHGLIRFVVLAVFSIGVAHAQSTVYRDFHYFIGRTINGVYRFEPVDPNFFAIEHVTESFWDTARPANKDFLITTPLSPPRKSRIANVNELASFQATFLKLEKDLLSKKAESILRVSDDGRTIDFVDFKTTELISAIASGSVLAAFVGGASPLVASTTVIPDPLIMLYMQQFAGSFDNVALRHRAILDAFDDVLEGFPDVLNTDGEIIANSRITFNQRGNYR